MPSFIKAEGCWDWYSVEGLLHPANSLQHPYHSSKVFNGNYRLTQELQIINSAVVPLHTVVPNLYTLVFLSSESQGCSLHYHIPKSKIFLFLHGQTQTISTQLTWSVLPQGFLNFPSSFWPSLCQGSVLTFPSSKLIQCDDLLCSPLLQHSKSDTVLLLNSHWGYKVSPSEVQLSTWAGILLRPSYSHPKNCHFKQETFHISLSSPTNKEQILSPLLDSLLSTDLSPVQYCMWFSQTLLSPHWGPT